MDKKAIYEIKLGSDEKQYVICLLIYISINIIKKLLKIENGNAE